MSGVNRVTILGRVGNDPAMRAMTDGRMVANVRLATSEQWKDKQTGDRKEKTEWHTVVLYEPLAQVAGDYVKKGDNVYIEGKLQTRKWQDKDGKDRYTT